MDRDRNRSRLPGSWDIVVIGGGATGLGCAVEAASRGLETLLLERDDFAKGTSSRSTKLIHGGVRYLRQGNVSLVFEALRERGRLIRNAPHIVHDLPFVIPLYDWWEGPFYGLGLHLYDALAGDLGLIPSKSLSVEQTIEAIPTVETGGLRGGIRYHDGQFDDARLAITLARTADDLGATVLNHIEVVGLLKTGGLVSGVAARDAESGEEWEIPARAVLNATGVFADAIRDMDEPESAKIIAPSQGVHIVLDRSFLPGSDAIMVPRTEDGRVLFAVPWHDRILVGTTDTPIERPTLEPRPMADELEFLLEHCVRYLTKDPGPADVLSAFAGLRPLVAEADVEKTAALSREHVILTSDSGLVTTTGGKWTTYRRMAEETLDHLCRAHRLDAKESTSRNLQLHGFTERDDLAEPRRAYGLDADAIESIERESEESRRLLHPSLPYTESEIVHGVRAEMARTVEDVLARRTRALLLDARASIEAAPRVAAIMARELGRDAAWAEHEVDRYEDLAKGYLIA